MRDRPDTVEENKDLRNQTRVTIGACQHLPYNITFGLSFGIGLQNPMTLDQSTPNERPQFAFYGEQLETLSVIMGVAYRPIRQLSIGVGASILVNSGIGIAANMPIGGVDSDGDGMSDEGSVGFRFSFKPTAAPYVGIFAAPIPSLRLGLAFRGALYHDLNTPVNIDVNIVGAKVSVPLYVESAAWYSPRQVAFGAAWDPIRDLTLAFDLTFYNWAPDPGPFLVVSEVLPDGCTPDSTAPECAPLLNLPTRERYGYRNVFVPRFGGEMRFLDGKLAARGGYAFRPSALPLPNGTRANLLDGAVHSITLGAGYRVGDRPPPPDAEHPASHGDARFAASVNAEIDVFFRANLMPERFVQKDPSTGSNATYRFGGNVYDLGATLTLGWY
jgi:long-subunit fatty acid transport protein